MKGSILYSFVFISLFFLLVIPFYSSAHGDGVSYEEVLGAYTVDIGYSSDSPEAGESVSFDFGLEENEVRAGFDDVWVRITSGERTFFAGGVHNSDFGGARMTYAFPDAGRYEVHFRYEKGSDALAEGSFSIEVSEDTQNGPDVFFTRTIYILIGAVVGFVATHLVRGARLAGKDLSGSARM